MRRAPLPLLSVLSLVSLAACSGEDPTTGDPNDVTETNCVATFRFLQKDAYKETAGRTSELWPPHTTTVLEIACDGELEQSAFQANHGTEPGAKDANGDVILVETKTLEVEGTRAELEALLDAYRTCECDGATKFLGLDSLEDEVAQDLVAEVVAYVDTNLTCEGITTEQLVAYLQAGAIDEVVAALPSCSWVGGASFEEGLDEALDALLAATSETLAGYHVCNNDAALQAQLVTDFLETGEVAACDAATDVCRGPRWLYTP